MGIGVHQLAILQGSEVAHVERALVRAPAAFLGFEAHKEGHHFRSCKPGFCPAFCFMVTSVPFHPVHRARPLWIISQKRTCVAIGPSRGASDHRRIIPQRRTWIAPRSSRRSEPGSRPDHHRITSRYHAQTVVGLPRGTMPKPSSIYSATPNLTRTRTLLRRLTWVPLPRHRPEAIARRPKTKNRLELQLFCD